MISMTKSVGSKKKDKTKIVKMDRKVRNKDKPKRDWIAIVHRGCRVAMFRIAEAMLLCVVVSLICVLIGSTAIPLLAYEMSSGFGLTQSTNIYIAFASWMLPMLFYALLITAATFCVLKKFIRWTHNKFTGFINKPKKNQQETEKETTTS